MASHMIRRPLCTGNQNLLQPLLSILKTYDFRTPRLLYLIDTTTSYILLILSHRSVQNRTSIQFFHNTSVQLLYGCTANTLHYPTRGRKQARRGNMMDWHITPRLRTLLRILYLVFGVLHSSIHFGVKMCTCNIYYALQDQCTLVHTILFKSWGWMHALKIKLIHSWSNTKQGNLLYMFTS
jgi:hypothetical protein